MQRISNLKGIRKQTILAISLSFFSLLVFFPSCYEPIEGCLDINSSNYLVSADRACDSCCLFPNFNLNVEQVFNGEDFALGDTLTNDLGTSFVINEYFLVFSDFVLRSEDQRFSIADSILLDCSANSEGLYFPADIIYLDKSTTTVQVGAIKTAQTFDFVSFKLGVDECIDENGIQFLENTTNSTSLSSAYDGSTFAPFYFGLASGIDSVFATLVGGDGAVSEINKQINASNQVGNTLDLNMKIDLGIWLSGISETDFKEAQINIVEALINNVGQAISFEE